MAPRCTELAVAEREAARGGIYVVTDTGGLCRAQHWVCHQARGPQPCSQRALAVASLSVPDSEVCPALLLGHSLALFQPG